MRFRGTGTADIPLPRHLLPYFSAPEARGLSVQFYGMLSGRTSIANVCTAIAGELTRRLPRVGLCAHNGPDFLDPNLNRYSRRDPGADIAILYGLPRQISLPRGFDRHRVKIGGFVCETDRIHPSWVTVCNRFDLICVPSRFCRDAFVTSGVTAPVLVVPHGLEPEYRPYHEPPPSSPFVFFNVFDAGSYIQRKSAEELVRTFCGTFGPDDDARLVLRTQDNDRMHELRRRYDHHDMVSIEHPETLRVAEFARRYSDVHCVVHPSKGEGFGLIPFQAIACERPVIAPAATGMADYIDDSNALVLRTGKPVPGIALGNRAGSYYSIDEDHLGELMRRVYDTWPAEYARVRKAAPAFRERHRWGHALQGLMLVVQGLAARDRTTSDVSGLISDLVARSASVHNTARDSNPGRPPEHHPLRVVG